MIIATVFCFPLFFLFSLKDFFAFVFCIRVCIFFFSSASEIYNFRDETIRIRFMIQSDGIEEMIIATVFCFPLFFLFSLKNFFAFVFCIRVCIFFFSSASEIYNFRDETIMIRLMIQSDRRNDYRHCFLLSSFRSFLIKGFLCMCILYSCLHLFLFFCIRDL